MKSDLPLTADDGWDMSPKREHDIVVDMPTAFEPIAPTRPLPSARGVLSAAEIEALLRPDLSDLDGPAAEAEPEPEQVTEKPVPDFNMAPAHRPSIRPQYEEEAARLAARLSLALRQDCGLRSAATVAASTNGTFQTALDAGVAMDGAAIACFASPAGEIVAMLVLSPPLSNALVETACGGQSGTYNPRPLSPLDAALLEGLVRPLGAALSPELSFSRVETDAEFAAALAGPEKAWIIDLNVRVEDERLPARLILSQFSFSKLKPAQARAEEPVPDLEPAPSSAAGAMTAVLTARIASLSVPLSRLSDLKAGSTLLLGVPADQPVELLAGGRDGKLAAEGEIGRKGGRMAIRITRRGPALRQG